MALKTLKCNHLRPLGLKVLRLVRTVYINDLKTSDKYFLRIGGIDS